MKKTEKTSPSTSLEQAWLLKSVSTFCQKVYHKTFGPEEGEKRFQALSYKKGLALWKAGLPESLSVR